METDAATDNGRTDGLSGAHERPYGVVLDVFEGPLDLLLYLIRKNEVDIYDIPISTIRTSVTTTAPSRRAPIPRSTAPGLKDTSNAI